MFGLLLQNVMVAAKLLKTDLLYHLLAQDQYFHMTYIISTSLSQTCIFAAYKKCSTVCNYNLNFLRKVITPLHGLYILLLKPYPFERRLTREVFLKCG